jgi:hypothetical protein
MVEGYVDEASLAWALGLTAKPRLGVIDRNDVFVLIGAGEMFEAIRRLIKVVAVEHIQVKSDLALGCRSWLRGYAGHDDEESLRRHIDGLCFRAPPEFQQQCGLTVSHRHGPGSCHHCRALWTQIRPVWPAAEPVL